MEKELSYYIDRPKRLVAYEPKFDRQAYSEATDKEKLDAYTKKQLETHLGERFNVLLSQTRFEIRNKEIYGENTQEPFMDMLQRGAKYRRENGNPVDFDREEAEVIGFSKIQTKLTDEDTKIGAMMLSISPPGKEESVYKHNFYDVFTLKQDEKGLLPVRPLRTCRSSRLQNSIPLRQGMGTRPTLQPLPTFRLPLLARRLRPAGAGGHGLRRPGHRCQHLQPAGSHRPGCRLIRPAQRPQNRRQNGPSPGRQRLPQRVARAWPAAGGEVFMG